MEITHDSLRDHADRPDPYRLDVADRSGAQSPLVNALLSPSPAEGLETLVEESLCSF